MKSSTTSNFFSWQNRQRSGLATSAAIVLLVLAAAAIRLYAWKNTMILNPDGPLYIHQARAIADGQWREALCVLPFLSNVSIFIALFHLFTDDWLLAARAVPLFFGTLAVIPLYGLLRQFFPKDTSLAAAAILLFLPTWVYNSVDGVRDPVCWFFSLSGLYWLARGLGDQRRLLLFLACTGFLLAAWARIEATCYIIATAFFLPFLSKQIRPATILASFYLPLVLIAAGIVAFDTLTPGTPLLRMIRFDDLYHTTIRGVPQYMELRDSLALLRQHQQDPLVALFLPEARRAAWLVALGTLANRLCEAMTYPFTLIALIGIGPFLKRHQNRAKPLLFALLTAGAFALLYVRTLQTWVMEYRYMMLAIMPGTLFFAAGLSLLGEALGRRLGLAPRPALALFALLLILVTLPLDFKVRGKAESAIKEIGLFLSSHHAPDDEVRVATSPHTVRLIRFYANLSRPAISCPERPEHLYSALIDQGPDRLIDNLRERRIDYLLWEENNRPAQWPLVLHAEEGEGALRELGRWHNHQTGTMILYQVKDR